MDDKSTYIKKFIFDILVMSFIGIVIGGLIISNFFNDRIIDVDVSISKEDESRVKYRRYEKSDPYPYLHYTTKTYDNSLDGTVVDIVDLNKAMLTYKESRELEIKSNGVFKRISDE